MNLSTELKQYLIITINYWVFTLTDGALRMLILLHFYRLGYTPLALAMLFLFYEVFGVVTNLVGGWVGARIGLNRTMNIGLFIQVIALFMLTVPTELLTVVWVMMAQALSGIAKDLNKMSAKSSLKLLVKESTRNEHQNKLFKWVALLTGSKNTLKGLGFFLGGFLLTNIGFYGAVVSMASTLLVIFVFSLFLLKSTLGKAKYKPKFSQVFSTHASLNYLSAARLCLFAARDVWFVVALPVYLASQLGWDFHQVGSFLALWIMAYGVVQAYAPKLFQIRKYKVGIKLAYIWSMNLVILMLSLSIIFYFFPDNVFIIIIGLFCFGFVFAINSSLHSFLIVALSKKETVSMDVGFYYTANALGRLLGTLLSGFIYQYFGLVACVITSTLLLIGATFFVKRV